MLGEGRPWTRVAVFVHVIRAKTRKRLFGGKVSCFRHVSSCLLLTVILSRLGTLLLNYTGADAGLCAV